jgi:molybdate transport system substrate-binding protein
MRPSLLLIASAVCLLAAPLAAPAQVAVPPTARVADAKPGDIRLIATFAIHDPIVGVLPQAQKAIGKPVFAQFGGARNNLRSEILAGQEFEVAILLPDVNAELLKAGKILPGEYEIARVDVGIALRGTPKTKLDVKTAAGLKAALLGATSVKYAPSGAAILTVRKLLGDLQVADKVKDNSARQGVAPLGAGEYEINLYPMSEIIPNKTLQNLGPVIPQFQVPVVMAATIGAHARDPAAARALIRFLQGPAIDAGLKAGGLNKSVGAKAP